MTKPNPFTLGYEAGKSGKPRTPPAHLKGGETARWFSGYESGAAERRKQQQPKQENAPA